VELLEMLGAERLVYGRLGDTMFTLRIESTLPPPKPGRHRACWVPTPRTCTGSTPPAASASEQHAAPAWPLPLWIAHRGAGKLAPENTLAAFRLGAAHGYRAFECDVKLSADGVPFLLHDATLERTTGFGQGRGRPALGRAVAAGRRQLAFARLCRRAAAQLAPWRPSCSANGLLLNIEIKPTPGLEQATGHAVGAPARRCGPGTVPPLLQLLPARGAGRRARDRARVPRALLVDSLWPGWLDVARSLGCVAVVSNHRLMDAACWSQLRAPAARRCATRSTSRPMRSGCWPWASTA
jgi:glycerophosphoryl diester phosphodiesterase